MEDLFSVASKTSFAGSKYSFTNGRRAEVIQEISLRELGIHRSDSPEKDRFPLGDLHVLIVDEAELRRNRSRDAANFTGPVLGCIETKFCK